MRRWQIVVATAAAGGTSAIAFQQDYSWLIALVGGVVAFVLLRWLLIWQGRVRHYFRHGNHQDRAYCPNCQTSRHRLAGDWVVTCKRCGWTAGWPGVRMLTRSVAMNQLRRTVPVSVLLIMLVGIGVVLSGGTVGVVPAIQDAQDDVSDDIKESLNYETEPSTGESGTSTDTVQGKTTTTEADAATGPRGYNSTKVESVFISLLNQERQERGLNTVTQRDELSKMGTAHAQNMARHDYLGHEQPDGTTIQDRYDNRGLLPECGLPIQGSDRYYPGAENAYQGWIDKRVTQHDGTTTYVSNETDLARVIFVSWMNSSPHRKAMLVASADQVGLGIANVEESKKIYVALELC